MSGAEVRHRERAAKWKARARPLPALRHHAWWLLHNVVAHPAIGVWPARPTIWLHDWTSQRLNRRRTFVRSPLPALVSRSAWLVHNVLAHVAIGLVPCRPTFDWHDRSARAMHEPDWI